ncbi:MAG: sigma-70 family RNA polymerase sigma factor, partial [Bryobacterales bacterium]|nr:sigma-70 family RNA polymerase sigma factor [Bryobacterales bacterium]
RQIATYIERAVANRKERAESAGFELRDTGFDPEALMMSRERRRIMREALSELNARDREVLVRFYIDEVPMETICKEMNLTFTQFRLLKSRAKARLSEAGQRLLRPKVLARYHATAAQ